MSVCTCGCGVELTGRQRTWASPACSRAGARFKLYGITAEEYDIIWKEQGECCAICKRKPRESETFHLDHEHAKGPSGPLRGILCPFCNTRLVGRLKSHERAQALADYLRDPPATRALGRVVVSPGKPKKRRRRKK